MLRGKKQQQSEQALLLINIDDIKNYNAVNVTVNFLSLVGTTR